MDAQKTEEGRLNAFYLGISGWQKAIRRTNRDMAQRMLRLVLTVSESKELQKFYKRLYTCLYEDVGTGDPEALRAIGGRLDALKPRLVYNDPKELVWITNALCKARKGDDQSAWKDVLAAAEKTTFQSRKKSVRAMKHARYNTGEPLVFAVHGALLLQNDREAFWEELPKLVPKDRIDLLRFCFRANSRGSEFAIIHGLTLPFDFPSDPLPDRPIKPRIYKGFPGYAIDWHTRLGRSRIINRLAKEHGKGTRPWDFAKAVWQNEGRLRKPGVYHADWGFRPGLDPVWLKLWKTYKKRIYALREEVMTEVYGGPEAE